MKPSALNHSLVARWLCVLTAVAGIGLLDGCGGSASTSIARLQPTQGASTTVTVVATSTGNDRLFQFFFYFDSITLTGSSGKTVTLLPGYEHDEFTHLNGNAEPLFTATVPQDTYTSASATIGRSFFSCLSGNSAGSVTTATFGAGYMPASQVTVSVPAPITVSGNSMILSLDLLTSQSASWNGQPCQCSGTTSFSITPTFNLAPAPAQAEMSGLRGVIASVDPGGSGFTVTGADGPKSEVTQTGATVTSSAPVWNVSTTSGTVFQGIGSVSGLTAGMPIEMDGTLQPDGSLRATRVAVADTDTSNLSYFSGPLASVSTYQTLAQSLLDIPETASQGALGGWIGAAGFTFDNASFRISGQLNNIDKLPFPANFNGTNVVAGQVISVTSHTPGWTTGATPPGLTTVTLIPQTINGRIAAVTNAGGFTAYTVTLATYDLFPQLATQASQPSTLQNPDIVIVYADSGTKMENAKPLGVGAVVRFYGLIFNDNGTLRMDCAQVNDGVAE